MNTDQIRTAYLGYFQEKGHLVVPSSSLVPVGDPTLLFTSAGMVQMKPYFLGEAPPPFDQAQGQPSRRLTSCQKCFRTTDIDSVGDGSHLTFFEMLGNFSVGDYFKQGAIELAWEFLTRRLGLPPERFWITVFQDDDEAFDIWRGLGVPAERIFRCGEKDNFWGPAGETGPCGPCTEIHYDFGPKPGHEICDPSHGCDRFLEVWNLVFMAYFQQLDGSRTSLPTKNVDTGMGLERIAAVMQGKSNVYETDVFALLIAKAEELTGRRYGESAEVDRALRVVAEHSRAVTFLIADGVLPSNEGRGYVLRRVLRRAVYFGQKLFLTLGESEGGDLRRALEELERRSEGWGKQAFLPMVVEAVIDRMGNLYKELYERRDFIIAATRLEEERFRKTLDFGRRLVSDLLLVHSEITMAMQQNDNLQAIQSQLKHRKLPFDIHPLGKKYSMEPVLAARSLEELRRLQPERISAQELFALYDTYGFPVELTREIVTEPQLQIGRVHGLEVDMEGYEALMAEQRERSRAAHRFYLGERGLQVYQELAKSPTQFLGYDTTQAASTIVGLVVDGEGVERIEDGQPFDKAQGKPAEVVLAETPFYGESGGQVGDTGEIRGPNGRFVVEDTVRPVGDLIVHRGRVVEGSLSLEEAVEAIVDQDRRLDIARNHTATHLLHAALRQVLGPQARQAGSLVAPDRLRFDFSHLSSLSAEELREVQRRVNAAIRQDLPVRAIQTTFQEAQARGAMALFDEKYGEQVRMVQVGPDPSTSSGQPFSRELCGGTHLRATGEIGYCVILSQSSIGAGLRRLEALTGRGAEALIEGRLDALDEAARVLGGPWEEVSARATAQITEKETWQRQAARLERELAQRAVEAVLDQVEAIDGIKALAAQVPATSMETLRQAGDYARAKLGSGVVVLGAIYDDSPHFLAMVTADLVARGLHAGDIVKKVAAVTGGSGGGRPELGQAGGRDKAKIEEALHLVRRLIKERSQVNLP